MSNVYPVCTLRWIRVLKISILVGRTCSCQRTAVRSCRRLIFPPFFPSREKEELKQLHRRESKINQNLTHKSHPHSSPRRPNPRPNTYLQNKDVKKREKAKKRRRERENSRRRDVSESENSYTGICSQEGCRALGCPSLPSQAVGARASRQSVCGLVTLCLGTCGFSLS